MQKIDDFKRKIMSELEKENTISFKNLYSRMNINSYQERSNFLEALYLLQIEEDVPEPRQRESRPNLRASTRHLKERWL